MYLVLQQDPAGVYQPGLKCEVEELSGNKMSKLVRRVELGQSLLSAVDNVLPVLQRLSEHLHRDVRTLVVLLQNSEEL